jgi:hypothetical protein
VQAQNAPICIRSQIPHSVSLRVPDRAGPRAYAPGTAVIFRDRPAVNGCRSGRKAFGWEKSAGRDALGLRGLCGSPGRRHERMFAPIAARFVLVATEGWF